MKMSLVLLAAVPVMAFSGCGDSAPRPAPTPVAAPKPKRPPTPEELLGIEKPGRLAASVEAWANANELGDYFRQSRERLSRLHAQLIEDFNVRKESDIAPTATTREMLRKYNEAFEADSTLRTFMVECYSRKEVSPLPQAIARVFTTSVEERGEIRANVGNAPQELARLKAERDSVQSELSEVGLVAWSQERELNAWRDLQVRLGDLSGRAAKASASASALAASLAKALRVLSEDPEAERLSDEAETLKHECAALVSRLSKQSEIVNGQMAVTKFADDCKAMLDGVTSVPALLSKKKARMAEIRDVTSRITRSRTTGFSDLNDLAARAAALKSRSQQDGAAESAVGKRVQKLAGNYERTFGMSAIYRLKREVPEPSAQARITAELSALKAGLNLQPGADPSGVFVNLESKSYQLGDRMEEESLLKRMDETLLAVRRLARSGR